MENRKYVKFLIPIFILGFFITNINGVFAYDIETHAFLTDEITEFYNKNFPSNKITDELKDYLIDGARREDDPPRWMNHFYDPIYNRGLTVDPKIFNAKDIVSVSFVNAVTRGSNWLSSKQWAMNSESQNETKYSPIIATILSSWQSGKIQKYFSASDFTFEEAVRYWVNGEKEMAMFALGHILHLIEDASVPDHTRNDPHPNDSPYEIYTSQFTPNNTDENLNKRLNNKNPIVLSDLNSYFDELAKYSNNGFYSKDTIEKEKGYDLPEPDFNNTKLVNDLYYVINKDQEGNEYYLLVRNSLKTLIVGAKPSIIIDENLVKDSYWKILSTKSVQYGAGVINLFFQEVKKAKNDQNFVKTKQKSFLGQTIDTFKNFFSDIFKNNNDFQQVGRIDLDRVENQSQDAGNQAFKTQNKQNKPDEVNQISQLITALESQFPEANTQQINQIQEEADREIIQKTQEDQKSAENQTQIQQNQQNSPVAVMKQCSFNTSQSPSRQKIVINEVAWMGGLSDFGLTATDEWFELKNISNREVNINGWQILDKSENIKIVFDNVTKIPANGFYLLERTNDDSVPGVVADKIYSGTLNNSDEGLRLFDDQCNLVDEVLVNPDWSAGDNDQKRTMERSPDLFWHTYNGIAQNGILGTPKKENSASTIISSGGGGSGGNNSGGSGGSEASTNNQQQTINSTGSPSKILINEIQIYPTENRFIELYNPNNFSVDLTNWYLQRKTQTGGSFGSLVSKTYFEGKTINANGYFLISRESFEGADIVLDNLTLKTDGNAVQIKNQNGDIIDKVGWGQASECENNCASQPSESQSIQRKIGPGLAEEFIDTDNNADDFEIRTCPSPKAQSQTCQSAESNLKEAPGASFNNILISEIQIAGDKADDEFIEIYNPTDNMISLAGYSIQYLSGTATSTNKISKKNFSNDSEVAAKSFYLLVNSGATSSLKNKADMTYSVFSLSGNLSGATLFLVGTTTVISNINDSAIVDSLSYGNPALAVAAATSVTPDSGESLERKAFVGDQCVSAQNDGEFSGNNCDTDSGTDFEIRALPNSQNSQNSPEPRSAPITPENFTVQYSSSAAELIFNWQESDDYSGAASTVVYEIKEYNSPGEVVFKEPATSTFRKVVNEFGRNYKFSIQAFDKDGLGSGLVEKEISVPSATLIVAQQLDKSIFSQGTGNGEFSQRLGNGLIGSPDSVTFHAGFPSTPTHASAFDIRAEFWESASENYDNLKRVSYNHCQPTDGWAAIIDPNCPNLNFEFDVDKNYTIPVLEKFIFDPNKYYKIRFVTYQSQSYFYGSASDDSYVYGYAAIEKGSEEAPPQLSEVKDLYFTIKSKSPIELPIGISFSLPQNFEISYTPEEPFLFFNWRQPRYFENASSVLTYKIRDVSDNGLAIADIETSGFSATMLIYEVGRRYKFAARVFNESGQESNLVQKEIIVPHHLTGPYVMISQLGGEISAQGTGNGEFFQTLGDGLNGNLGAVTFWAKFASIPQSIRVNFYEADNADFIGAKYTESAAYCGIGADSACDNQIIELGIEKKYTIPSVKDYVFNPVKYYKFEIITYQSSPDFYGSESDIYQNGAAGAPHGVGAIKDLYFVISSRIPLIVLEGL